MVNKNDVLLLNEIKKKKYLSPSISVCGTLMKGMINAAGASAGGSDNPFDGTDYDGEISNAKERFYSEDFFSNDSYGDYE